MGSPWRSAQTSPRQFYFQNSARFHGTRARGTKCAEYIWRPGKKGGYISAPDPTLLKHSGNSAKLTADPEQETITKAGKQLQAPTGPTKPRTVCRSVRLYRLSCRHTEMQKRDVRILFWSPFKGPLHSKWTVQFNCVKKLHEKLNWMFSGTAQVSHQVCQFF